MDKRDFALRNSPKNSAHDLTLTAQNSAQIQLQNPTQTQIQPTNSAKNALLKARNSLDLAGDLTAEKSVRDLVQSANLSQIPHTPVLLNEVLQAFKDIENGVIVDATLGFGGHSEAILKAHKGIKLIACEQDIEALDFARTKLAPYADRTEFHHLNFAELLSRLDMKSVKGVLADIGVSSFQIDNDKRGFSVYSNALDMRMDARNELDAFKIVNFYPQNEIERIFRDFGELKDAPFLAQKICEIRAQKPISSAKELAQILGTKKIKGRNSASRAILGFQALRIAVNNELGALQKLLNALQQAKPSGCIVAIISFHSLEDRLVKNAFKQWAKSCICPEFALQCTCQNNHNLGKILTKKALVPSERECKANPRASCAKMRVFRFD